MRTALIKICLDCATAAVAAASIIAWADGFCLAPL
jgi:hypothetical protein